MRKPLAQRNRERAAQHALDRKARRTGVVQEVTPEPIPVVEEPVEEEDAAELEYQEKKVRKKRSYTRRKKKDQ